jgi:hypothetical protein
MLCKIIGHKWKEERCIGFWPEEDYLTCWYKLERTCKCGAKQDFQDSWIVNTEYRRTLK